MDNIHNHPKLADLINKDSSNNDIIKAAHSQGYSSQAIHRLLIHSKTDQFWNHMQNVGVAASSGKTVAEKKVPPTQTTPAASKKKDSGSGKSKPKSGKK